MNRLNRKTITKIFILSTFLVLIFNIIDIAINANATQSKNKNNIKTESNKSSFQTADKLTLGKTGVAITTNLGTRKSEKDNISSTIYKEVFSVAELISNQEIAKNEIIGKNMLILQDYRNILKTDFRSLIRSANNKSIALDAYVEQLEYRYINAVENIKVLETQKASFISDMDSANEKIENLKIKVTADFKNNDSKASLENIDKYLEYKEEFYYARTYTIYINHFLNEYSYLNGYSKVLLDTIINNKDAIIKDSFIVIPDSGSEGLRNFELLFSEEEYKAK